MFQVVIIGICTLVSGRHTETYAIYLPATDCATDPGKATLSVPKAYHISLRLRSVSALYGAYLEMRRYVIARLAACCLLQ